MRNEATCRGYSSALARQGGPQTLWRIRYVSGSVTRPPRIVFAFLAAVFSAFSGRRGSRSETSLSQSLGFCAPVSCCPLPDALLGRA